MTLLLKFETKHFHFENLYKLNDDQTPRISTRVGKTLVGIDPQMLEDFINDALFCFDEGLARYLEWVADNKLRRELRWNYTKQ